MKTTNTYHITHHTHCLFASVPIILPNKKWNKKERPPGKDNQTKNTILFPLIHSTIC